VYAATDSMRTPRNIKWVISHQLEYAQYFTNTGINFCGLFYIKEKKYRNRVRIKIYICVFVCMIIKVIHLEIVNDLSFSGFIAALRRFVARRGVREHIYSDNRINFVGANNQLREMYALLNSEEHKDHINRYASEYKITWHFIPPLGSATFRRIVGVRGKDF